MVFQPGKELAFGISVLRLYTMRKLVEDEDRDDVGGRDRRRMHSKSRGHVQLSISVVKISGQDNAES